MSGYTKLSSALSRSTIWDEPDNVRIVWITMLSEANRWGEVESSIPGLALMARKSIQDTEAALARLMEPDPYSRTKENNGRRIAEIDGGWEILNYAKYREKKSKEHENEMAAERQRRHRKRKSVTEDVTLCHALSRSVTVGNPIAEADSYAEADQDQDLVVCCTNNSSNTDAVTKKGGLRSFSRGSSPASSNLVRSKQTKKVKKETSSHIWSAYATAYEKKYGVPPVRNARQNALCAQLLKLLGQEAEQVAEYYLSVRTSLYAGSSHSLALLVRDAEKIRTECLTGRSTTMHAAREQDRLQATGDMWANVIAKHTAKEGG